MINYLFNIDAIVLYYMHYFLNRATKKLYNSQIIQYSDIWIFIECTK